MSPSRVPGLSVSSIVATLGPFTLGLPAFLHFPFGHFPPFKSIPLRFLTETRHSRSGDRPPSESLSLVDRSRPWSSFASSIPPQFPSSTCSFFQERPTSTFGCKGPIPRVFTPSHPTRPLPRISVFSLDHGFSLSSAQIRPPPQPFALLPPPRIALFHPMPFSVKLDDGNVGPPAFPA